MNKINVYFDNSEPIFALVSYDKAELIFMFKERPNCAEDWHKKIDWCTVVKKVQEQLIKRLTISINDYMTGISLGGNIPWSARWEKVFQSGTKNSCDALILNTIKQNWPPDFGTGIFESKTWFLICKIFAEQMYQQFAVSECIGFRVEFIEGKSICS